MSLHRRHVHDVLVAFRRAQHQRFSRAFKMNGAMAFTSCTSSNSTTAPRPAAAATNCARANPPAANPDPAGLRETNPSARRVRPQQRTCDNAAACVSPATCEMPVQSTRWGERPREPFHPPAADDSRANLRKLQASDEPPVAGHAMTPFSRSIMC